MRTVWKYELRDVETILDLPADAKVLHVAVQGGAAKQICLWAELEPNAPTVERQFFVVGTGQNIPPAELRPTHVGTFLSDAQGTFVFHVYEVER